MRAKESPLALWSVMEGRTAKWRSCRSRARRTRRTEGHASGRCRVACCGCRASVSTATPCPRATARVLDNMGGLAGRGSSAGLVVKVGGGEARPERGGW